MPTFTNARHAEDIHRELTDILRGLKDPRIDPMLSIIRVELSKDGSDCKVYVSSLQGIEKAKESVKGLSNGSGFIRREIGHRLKLRYIPNFTFIADDTTEYGVHIAKVLNDLKKDNDDEK